MRSLTSPRAVRGASPLLALACALAAGCGRDTADRGPAAGRGQGRRGRHSVDGDLSRPGRRGARLAGSRDPLARQRHPDRQALRRRRDRVDEGHAAVHDRRARIPRAGRDRRRESRVRRGEPRRAPGRTSSATSRCSPRTRSASRSTTTPSPPAKEAAAQVARQPRRDHRSAARRRVRRGARTDDRANRCLAGLRRRADHRRADPARDDLRRRSRLGQLQPERKRAARLPAALWRDRARRGQRRSATCA